MIQLDDFQSPFSANVDLQLVVGEKVHRVGKSGPGYAFLCDPVEVPLGSALLIVTVDDMQYALQITVVHSNPPGVPFDNRIEYRIERVLPAPAGERQLSLFGGGSAN